jgi:hypothetical protein
VTGNHLLQLQDNSSRAAYSICQHVFALTLTTKTIFTRLLNPESKTYSNRIVLDNLDSGVRNLDLDPALKAVFRTQGPPTVPDSAFLLTANLLPS